MSTFKFTILTAVAAMSMAAATAQAGFTDFEGFTVDTSVNGQGGWTVADMWGNAVLGGGWPSGTAYDQEVVDDGGNTVWRFSNAVTTNQLSNQPNATHAPLIAGETSAKLYNDYGPDHTSPNNPPLANGDAASKYFHVGWDFKSATGAAQPGLAINVSPAGSQSTLRLSYLQMLDTGSGFDLVFTDTTGTTFSPAATIASGLNYTDWHSVDMYVEFVDGLGPGASGSEAGNDIVKVFLNGSLIHTGTTWESFFYNVADSGPLNVARAVNTAVFYARGNMAAAVPSTDGYGFFFDNVLVDNAAAPVPEPGTVALIGLTTFGLAGMRRRRK